jgi:hypothetical protein
MSLQSLAITPSVVDDARLRAAVAAADAILEWRHGHPVVSPDPGTDLIVRTLSVSMAETVPDEYGDLLVNELALGACGQEVSDVSSGRVPVGSSARRERRRRFRLEQRDLVVAHAPK